MQVPEPSLSVKLGLLWTTNKPLVIGIIVGIVLLILAIIFVIIFFAVIRPGMASNNSPAVADKSSTTGTTTSTTTSGSSATDSKKPSPKHAISYQTLRTGNHLESEWVNWFKGEKGKN